MCWVEKLTVVLLLFLSALLYAHGASVLRTKDLNETNSLLSSIHSQIAEECDCGVYGICHFEDGRKKCTCVHSTAELDGKCKECNCGLEYSVCIFSRNGTKQCFCGDTHIDVNGQCRECNCGSLGLCRFESGQKKCTCRPGFIESDGKCIANKFSTPDTIELSSETTTILTSTVTSCDCGFDGACHLDSSGEKICNCFSGYAPYEGYCHDCNCGEHSKSCSYNWWGDKICDCFPGYVENHGTCEDEGTSSEVTTDSTTTYRIGSTTVKECDCGRFGRCTFEYGRKKCICDLLTSERNGKCVECDCGKNTISCNFDWKGDKACNCTSGYAQVFGICEDCKCGVNARSCFFRDNGIKVCNCDFGYIQTNGYCSAICNEDKCIHGKCEIVGNGFKCRCNEGFTGQRCEEKILTKSNKQNLWMVLLLSGVFAIVILLSCMFCFLTRILNKMTKK